MIPIYLEQLLPVFKGKIISRERNPLIKHVMKFPNYSLLKEHTLIFHSKQLLSFRHLSHIKDLVIITENPHLLSHIGRNVTVVKVKSSKKAYWRFIDFYRGLFLIPFIAVTGTCGKTTTKEMISWIFSKDHTVYKTIRNENDPSRHFNYLLGIDNKTDVVVMETAVAIPGHLKKAYRYFKPQVGVLTSIGIDHLNGFPDLASYIQEKLSIFSVIDSNGTVVVNVDNEHIKKINLDVIDRKIVTYGTSEGVDFFIFDVEYLEKSMKFRLYHNHEEFSCIVPGLGQHNVYNATAAIAAAHQLGLPIKTSLERLLSFPSLPRHVEIVSGIKGSILIDDTWSSNPTSIQSSLEVLKNISAGKKRLVLLGEMKFLGNQTEKVHALVGDMVFNEEIDSLITIGQDALPIALKAIENGMDKNRVHQCNNPDEAYRIVVEKAEADSVILLKTSMYQSYKKLARKLRQNAGSSPF